MPPVLRRSNRIRKPSRLSLPRTSPVQTTNRALRGLQPKNALDGFMVKLYAEIHAAAVAPIPESDHSEIRDVLRKARTVRFLELLSGKSRDDVTTALESFSSSTRRVGSVHRDAMDIIKVSPSLLRDRLCRFPSLLLLSICVHSETFRTALSLSPDAANGARKANDEPSWQQLSAKLEQSASSLELFAKTRGLEWRKALGAHEDDFGVLLRSVLRDFDFGPVTQADFGIGPGELDEMHEVDDTCPSHWVLPPAPAPAFRCAVEYKVTDDVIRDGFRIQDDGVAAPQLDDDQFVQQFDVAHSILLPNYDWTNLAPQADGDPRFCGFKDHPCDVCGQESSCDCTFADMCDSAGHGREVLVELMTTERTGTGVRALQDIRADQYVGEYVGEIYPAKHNHRGGHVTRYEGDAGHTYILELDIARASDFVQETSPKRRRGKGSSNVKSSKGKSNAASSSSGAAVKTTKAGKASKAKPRPRRPAYFVDSAVRGNWTRYINHSCVPNTRFDTVNVGQRHTVLIRATRRIYHGEQLTVDYGDRYFCHFEWGCKCAHATCRYWREGVGVEPDAVTLKMAKDQGIAPQWALDDDAVPIEKDKDKDKDGGAGKGKGKGRK
ncbi:hypothetical protein A1O3_03374 [Capronia epimyces CBS 606.96]|uniref:SET domain-containing protein n=1 Tax=Capronia epimyces CBS 606.96 TaxID=1182542 RepID=W9Y1R4_9EURO|nr:uncharacterized protein A1O3_03374 [Capronia epimyces CBS 606.96]EXJ86423.1 hypothetical protein A1O3_03374 [Capronia epimyces CBS 606.96]